MFPLPLSASHLLCALSYLLLSAMNIFIPSVWDFLPKYGSAGWAMCEKEAAVRGWRRPALWCGRRKGGGGVTEPLDYGINQKAASSSSSAAAFAVHHPLWQNMLSSVGGRDSATAEGRKEGGSSSILPLFVSAVRHPRWD